MTRDRDYPVLLASMVVLGALFPLLARGGLGTWIWWLSFWLMMLAAVRVAAKSPRQTRLAYGLLVVVVGLGLVDRATVGDTQEAPWLGGLRIAMVVAHLALFALAGHAVLRDVMRAGTVTAEKIYGAVCFYLLLGIAWGFGFTLVGLIDGAAFGAPGGTDAAVPDLPDFLYLSFVTLSTVGYGDFVPRSDVARLAATGEAIVGQLYLTILVARLVGLHIAHGESGGRAGGDATG